MMAKKSLSLTTEHVARVHRVVSDHGLAAGVEIHSDAEYDAWVRQMIMTHPAPLHPTRLFAFGSLIWKPEIEHTREQIGVAQGWHRSFCMRMTRFRGTPDQPGLMMALDRGGQCHGVVFDLPDQPLDLQLGKLFRREFTYKPINNVPRWITVRTADGPTSALAFVMNRSSPHYVGRQPLEAVADTLSVSCGHWGTGAEYLLNTVTHLAARGISDRNLWRLQGLVAERIESHADFAVEPRGV